MTKTEDKRAILITTEHRGVFFGYVDAEETPMAIVSRGTVVLDRARLCVYWSADVRGFMGLAEKGPTSGCRIGPAISDFAVNKVTSAAYVAPAAVDRWEKGPWS